MACAALLFHAIRRLENYCIKVSLYVLCVLTTLTEFAMSLDFKVIRDYIYPPNALTQEYEMFDRDDIS